MKISYLFACAGALALAAGSASAQTADASPPGLPGAATITAPDVAAGIPERDSSGDAKYFYFQKPGMTFERAVADFRECFGYANPPIPPVLLPAFVLLEETAPGGGRVAGPSPYGLIGEAVGALLVPVMKRRNAMGNMRICMGYKAYRRYPTTKSAYLVLNEGDDLHASILMLAKIASGPAPATESLVP